MQTIIETVYAEHGIENIPRATANMAEDEDCGWEGGSWASLFMREVNVWVIRMGKCGNAIPIWSNMNSLSTTAALDSVGCTSLTTVLPSNIVLMKASLGSLGIFPVFEIRTLRSFKLL